VGLEWREVSDTHTHTRILSLSPEWQKGSLYPSSVLLSPRSRITSPALSTSQIFFRASRTVWEVCCATAAAISSAMQETLASSPVRYARGGGEEGRRG
jgi:hypothetical protein